MKNHKLIYGISIIFALFSLVLASKPLEKFEKTYKTGKSAVLEVSSSSGDVSIKRGGNEVIVVGLIRAGHSWKMSASKADEVAKYIKDNPPITHSGKKVIIKKIDREDSRVVYINYEITVPQNTQVSISTGSGDLEVVGVSGPAELSTGSGDVYIESVKKGAELSTGSGDITGKSLAGDISARTGSGDINIKFSDQADLRASTGSGDITIDRLEGSLTARTGSGNATVSGTAVDEWKISTGSGDVKVTLSDKIGYNVNIKTNSGYIETEPPITVSGRIKRNEIEGKIRGGGKMISLSTGSGDIYLR